MAFDYGAKRTGIAVTDTGQMIATGLAGVDTTTLFDFVTNYLVEEPVERFVVGYPVGLDGQPTHATSRVDRFLAELAKRWPTIPISTTDERFSSREAMATLVASGVRKKARRDKKLLDQVTATILLREWLESREAGSMNDSNPSPTSS